MSNNSTINNTTALTQLAASGQTGQLTSRAQRGNWFQALADAWGTTLDNQANRLLDLANEIGPGQNDRPSVIAQLTAESQKMGYLSTSQNTSLNSVGEGLKTMARKQ